MPPHLWTAPLLQPHTSFIPVSCHFASLLVPRIAMCMNCTNAARWRKWLGSCCCLLFRFVSPLPQDHQGCSTSRHHSPHFTICSVACVPPPPVLWTATHCSLIPGDTVPIIMVLLFCFLLFELHLLQQHVTTLIMDCPLCCNLIPAKY